jgi:hypothetical protein
MAEYQPVVRVCGIRWRRELYLYVCSYMFRSNWTILRERIMCLAKTTILWNWSVKIHRCMTCGRIHQTTPHPRRSTARQHTWSDPLLYFHRRSARSRSNPHRNVRWRYSNPGIPWRPISCNLESPNSPAPTRTLATRMAYLRQRVQINPDALYSETRRLSPSVPKRKTHSPK